VADKPNEQGGRVRVLGADRQVAATGCKRSGEVAGAADREWWRRRWGRAEEERRREGIERRC
jgi:hypothetical protein